MDANELKGCFYAVVSDISWEACYGCSRRSHGFSQIDYCFCGDLRNQR